MNDTKYVQFNVVNIDKPHKNITSNNYGKLSFIDKVKVLKIKIIVDLWKYI